MNSEVQTKANKRSPFEYKDAYEASGENLTFQLSRLDDQIVELDVALQGLLSIKSALQGVSDKALKYSDCEVREAGIVGRFKHLNDMADERISAIKELVEEINKKL